MIDEGKRKTEPNPFVLLVGSYAEPNPIGGNRTLYMQARLLQELGCRVEVLTWPINDTWRGPIPTLKNGAIGNIPYQKVTREGVKFHVVSCPGIWSDRVLTNAEWTSAVDWGMEAVNILKPDILHQQFWQSTWWMLEAAHKVNVKTIYSAHDYGILCLKNILVTGEDKLCDGIANVEKCSQCIYSGRNHLGKMNEFVASLPLGEAVLSWAFGKNADGPLARRGGIRMELSKRVGLTMERFQRTFAKVKRIIVASPFAAGFFAANGVKEDKIISLPWFQYEKRSHKSVARVGRELCLAFVGRISQDKGVHLILEALETLDTDKSLVLKVAGAIDSDYARNLKMRYPEYAGKARIVWCGWLGNEELYDFYSDVHIAVVPSVWYDNTPLALVEALGYGRPVICTNVPSLTHLVVHGKNGRVFAFNDKNDLAQQIEIMCREPDLVRQYAENTRNVMSGGEYGEKVKRIYWEVYSESTRNQI